MVGVYVSVRYAVHVKMPFSSIIVHRQAILMEVKTVISCNSFTLEEKRVMMRCRHTHMEKI